MALFEILPIGIFAAFVRIDNDNRGDKSRMAKWCTLITVEFRMLFLRVFGCTELVAGRAHPSVSLFSR